MRTNEQAATPPASTRRPAPEDEAFERALVAARVALLFALRRRGFPIDRAEDLAQAASVNALEARARFDAGRDMLPWLLTIALRLDADERRRLERRPAEGALPADLSVGESATETALLGEERLLLGAAMGALSRSERAIVDLFYREGLSIGAIAERLALASGTVKSHLHRARAALAAEIERRTKP